MTAQNVATPVHMAPFDGPRLLRLWAETRTPRDACAILHVISHAASAPSAAAIRAGGDRDPAMRPWADALADACWGLLPGVHRLRLRAPRPCDASAQQPVPPNPTPPLHLTLCIGDRAPLDALIAATPHAAVPDHAQAVTVLGAGLAGASCARALAERGYRVTVLDQGDAPAAGASGLPVGLVAPHTSPDDSILSRLSRAGMRAMRDALQHHLVEGMDWGDSGVQERRLPGKTRKGGAPASWAEEHPETGSIWTRACNDPDVPANTLWHAKGAWVRPARLVAALLDHPRIRWQGNAQVQRLDRTPEGWQVWAQTPAAESEADGRASQTSAQRKAQTFTAARLLAHSPQLVLACGPATPRLLAASGLETQAVPIRPLRGQLSWGLQATVENDTTTWPATPVNGHGCFVHGIDTPQGPAWFAGSTFDRLRDQPVLDDADHAENLERLRALLPDVAASLQTQFADGRVQGWAGVRCSVPDRLPMVGAVPHAPDGLWVCSAMGSRGLTLALLCGELLAAQWTGEPLPIELQLARALSAGRFAR